jgi:hypothetical protein
MICAMFLTKDLMTDWRIGEKVLFYLALRIPSNTYIVLHGKTD